MFAVGVFRISSRGDGKGFLSLSPLLPSFLSLIYLPEVWGRASHRMGNWRYYRRKFPELNIQYGAMWNILATNLWLVGSIFISNFCQCCKGMQGWPPKTHSCMYCNVNSIIVHVFENFPAQHFYNYCRNVALENFQIHEQNGDIPCNPEICYN